VSEKSWNWDFSDTLLTILIELLYSKIEAIENDRYLFTTVDSVINHFF
jgi:hypothetical protein